MLKLGCHMRVLPVVFLAFVVVLAAAPVKRVDAAASDLATQQSCLGTGSARVTFSWQSVSQGAAQQWLDLSLSDNGWIPGTFLGAGPLGSTATSYTWDGLVAGRVHYVRVNQRLQSGAWDPSHTFIFTTVTCGSPASQARDHLATLAVMPAGPMTGYSRDQFGPAWEDVDNNDCDTRNDILRRDLTNIVLRPGSTCIVERGILADPYTGKTINFVRGQGTSLAVQIDHVVALGDAWRTGAASWTAGKRLQYANDPLVLLAVDGPANGAKSDRDAAGWLPPNPAYHCTYVERQVTIKVTYMLWVTPAERDAMLDKLADCDADPSKPGPDETSSAASEGHTWYTSAASNASVYYCELDEGWKGISPSNLRSYPSLEALLTAYPSRTKSATSKC